MTSFRQLTYEVSQENQTKASPVSGLEDEERLESFIDKFDSKNATLIRAVRKAMRRRLPSANELVYDNYNFFVIGYCPTERPSDCIVSIAAAANGVGLAFYHGATLPDPHKLLLGSGRQNRFIRVVAADALRRPRGRSSNRGRGRAGGQAFISQRKR